MRSFSANVIAVFLIVGFLGVWSVAHAGIVCVAKTGNDANDGLSWTTAKLTIQAGLNAAVAGDEVWVATGTYVQAITLKAGVGLYGGFSGSESELVQRDWKANEAIIDGNSATTTVTAPSEATSTTRIDGFTIRNAGRSAGVRCVTSSPTIANNLIADNRGQGIYCSASSSPVIKNNTITRNSAAYAGGIYCSASSPAITNNTITGNTGGGIYCTNSSPTIANNTITGNSGGSGISCANSSSTTITNNVINDHAAGGIVCSSSSGTIRNNTITANTNSLGGGISCTASALTIENNTITANSATGSGSYSGGGGIYCASSPSIRIADNIIKDNTAGGTESYCGGGGILCVASSGAIENNTIAGNTAAASGTLSGGGGIYCTKSSSPTIRNNRIVANNAAAGSDNSGGGGIRCDSSSAPNVTNNEIAVNSAVIAGQYGDSGSGGGIFCHSSSPAITNNTIKGNKAVSGGGAYCSGSSLMIANNIVTCNTAQDGGGIVCNGSSTLIVASNTIAHNTATYGGGLLCPWSSSATIVNTIIAFNSSGIYADQATPNLRFNCVFGNSGLNYDGLTDPTATNGNISVDPKLANAPYGNIHIQPNSPCVDAGDDAALRAGWVDMDGQVRLLGSHCDIGADESDGTTWPQGPSGVVRVSTEGDDANDGSSWASAKRTVQAGIEAAALLGGDVWIATGVYEERIILKPYAHLLGGFDGGEAQQAERDWRTNVTILDGKQAGSVVTADCVAYGTSTVDGFTIRNGKAPYGAGVCCLNSSPLIANNTIKANVTSSSGGEGGGIYCSSASPIITRNTISGNSAYSAGGGICCSSCSPSILNNVINANSAVSFGGGIYCYGSPIVCNNTITGNSSSYGGGIWCRDSSVPTITNNILAFNSSGFAIAGMTGTPALRNNCVYGNVAYNFSGITDPAGTNGNMSTDPQLVDLAHGDVHVQPDSPCIDSGEDSAVQSDWTDIDNQIRIAGSHVDIGADESDGTTRPAGPYAIIRVAADGNDANDGTSWTLAKRTVQAGIDAAGAAGGQVWVQAGTYNERILLLPFVHLYGGFAGTENAVEERDWRARETILDGQQNGSVVTARAGQLVSRIDGFTIRNGKGYGIYCSGASPTICNNQITNNSNSGVYCTSASPRVADNTITRNFGGGIYCYTSSSPSISGNTITANSTTNDGGGIYCYTSATITGNMIAGNVAAKNGGGIYCGGGSATVANNTIIANSAASYGGGIHFYGSPTMANNTITGNSASDGAGVSSTSFSSATITNTIIAFNSSGIYVTGTGALSLRHNCVYGNTAYNYSGIADPTGTNGNISTDPTLVDVAHGNAHIQPDSPCVDAGNGADRFGESDVDGQVRILPTGGAVDIGADESDGTLWQAGPYAIVRVSPNGNDANDGSSWAMAKRTVQAGIDAAGAVGGDVWVQSGTYGERITLLPFSLVYGGFSGSENTLDERDWTANTTTLDGQQGGSVVTAKVGHRVSRVDGFTIRNGTGTLSGSSTVGGGIYCLSSGPMIANSTIAANTASSAGGGIYCSGSSPMITDNSISDNRGSVGGGIYCTNAAPTIVNNTIKANTASSAGGGVYSSGSSPTITRNTIAENTVPSSGQRGGGICLSGGSPTISGNTITGNSASDGGGIGCSGSSPTIANNTIEGNSGSNGGGIYYYSSSPTVVNNKIVSNTASNGGGLYCESSSSMPIANNTFGGNTASYGGGLYCAASSPVIANNTITENSASYGGGGVYCSSSSPTIANTIIAFNGSGIQVTGTGTPVLHHNCVYGNTAYNYFGIADPTGLRGNISAEPKLADLARGNVHLQPDSPCVDAGNNADVVGDSDLDGQPRILPVGGTVDIGADESDGTAWPALPHVIVRVAGSGDDANDGSSWSLAKRRVQAGVAAASTDGGEVWVQAGTYYERITLLPQVCLYGGFAGAENELNQRDWKANKTILDAQKTGSVITVRTGELTSRIDGFTIRNGAGTLSGSYLLGGGIYCISSSPTITNNTIIGNSAASGGGIYCTNGSPLITNNTVAGNSGGGIFCASSSPTITANTITSNSGSSGGGIYCAGSPLITTNTISGNSAASGGGLYCSGGVPTVANNKLAGNTASGGASAITCTSSKILITGNTIVANTSVAGSTISADGGSLTIANTILAFNGAGISTTGSCTSALRNNCIHGNIGFSYFTTYNPPGTNGNIPDDPKLADLAHGDFHIQPDSPCVGTGNNADAFADRDIDGQLRIQPFGGTVDIGADESDGTVWSPSSPAIVRVSPDGDDSNDGSSWVLAKRTVQGGILAASALGGDVWVRTGTYNQRITFAAFTRLYGGFAGNENALGERDWKSNRTILDGQQGGAVVSIVKTMQECRIDGFTIRNGNTLAGGGVYCLSSSPTITNNTIIGNVASSIGGGVYCSAGSPTIVGNVIAGNFASSYYGSSNDGGGGVYCYSSSPTIANNRIVGNTATPDGGGLYCTGSTPTIANNTIAANVAASSGSGIYCSSSTPTIANNIVAFNESGVYVKGTGTPTFRNNCVYDNAAYNYTGVADPTGTNGNISADPKFADPAHGNVHLQPGSPCVNAGNNADTVGETDMDGQIRTQPLAGTVDIGADESDGMTWPVGPYATIYVSSNGDDAHDGSSWNSSKRTVQAGIVAASTLGGEVWIQRGTYREQITLSPFTYVYGGFIGTETSRDQRDWRTQITILDGQAAGSVVTIRTGQQFSRVDGFMIRNGRAVSGGGIYCYCSSPTIANNTITASYATNSGGAISCFKGSPMIAHNTIAGNVASYYGGGISASGSPTITNNAIVGNTTYAFYEGGGGILCGSGSPTITNNTIIGNMASSSQEGYGGGIRFSSSPMIANNIIAFNSSGLYGDTNTATLRNNCVYNPAGYNYSGFSGLAAGTGDISVDPLFVNRDAGDYHLAAGSPCIDAGYNTAVPGGILTDLDGYSRFFDDPATPDCQWAPGNCGTAPIIDMGAYEYLPAIPGDFDRDRDIDAGDLKFFVACLSGPTIPYTGDCLGADFDLDNDVDQSDFGLIQRCFSGAGIAVEPACGN